MLKNCVGLKIFYRKYQPSLFLKGNSQFKTPTFRVKNAATGLYMTAKGEGQNITIETNSGDNSQIWYFLFEKLYNNQVNQPIRQKKLRKCNGIIFFFNSLKTSFRLKLMYPISMYMLRLSHRGYGKEA